ncbi:10077_t:CDS:1, partial [Gigaspora margarita]
MTKMKNNLHLFYNRGFNFETSFLLTKGESIRVRRSQRQKPNVNYREKRQYIKKQLDINLNNLDTTYISNEGSVVNEPENSSYFCKICENYFFNKECLCGSKVSDHVSKYITKQNGFVTEDKVEFSDEEMQLVIDDSSDEEFPDPEEVFKSFTEKSKN